MSLAASLLCGEGVILLLELWLTAGKEPTGDGGGERGNPLAAGERIQDVVYTVVTRHDGNGRSEGWKSDS